MVKVKVQTEDKEPMANFSILSEGKHSFRIVEVIDTFDPDPNVVHAKVEVISKKEIGKSTINRCVINSEYGGFFATQLMLKAIGEPYKGDFDIDTDNWIGCEFVANIKHTQNKDKTKTYANIDSYEFDEKPVKEDVIGWDE